MHLSLFGFNGNGIAGRIEYKDMKIMVVLLLVSTVCFGQTVNDLRPTVTMKEYVDMQADLNKEWMQKFINAQFENIKDNVDKATTSMDKRLDGMNEFRDTLKDQAGTFITRAELFAWIIALVGLFLGVSNYRRQQKESQGKAIVSGDKVEVKK